MPVIGYYDALFARSTASGLSLAAGAELVANAFLDGKPAKQGKRGNSAAERHAAFWHANFLKELPPEAWMQESIVLALARYFAQDCFACPSVLGHVAGIAPDAIRRSARYSGLVSRQGSPRLRELEVLAEAQPAEFAELVRVFGIFKQAREERVAVVNRLRQSLAELTPLELLAYASLYSFERILPAYLKATQKDDRLDADLQSSWDAIEAILTWKLATCRMADMQLDDTAIGLSLRRHLSPFLFPSQKEPPRHDLYVAFAGLIAAQVELAEFESRSADAFSYDDSIRFVRRGTVLEIDVIDADAKAAWHGENTKLARLHQYWLYRGMNALLGSPELLTRTSPKNADANQQALAKAMRTWLQLQEIYGVDPQVKTDSGLKVDVFDALKAIELMTAFYIEDFLLPYKQYLQEANHPWQALGQLALAGMARGENRMPLTWSERPSKIARIRPWTASTEYPQGQTAAAEAIVDFWTSDWKSLADRLRGADVDSGLQPRLQERPILKLGRHLFQLPWMMAMQNNSVAAINNLRRIGARRADQQAETRRIEQRLGKMFADRGFSVLVGHELRLRSTDDVKAGDIDLLCARDGCLLLLELKSTFFRRSGKDAWLHRTSTLRKAGLQLYRKVAAVRQALDADESLRHALGLDTHTTPAVTAWIIDTSIECDHQHFSGFLKVSLEEVVIALRDDRLFLDDPDGLFCGDQAHNRSFSSGSDESRKSLYPHGFSAGRFVDVVESEEVWRGAA